MRSLSSKYTIYLFCLFMLHGGVACQRFTSPEDTGRPPFLQIQTILSPNIPIELIGSVDITLTALPDGPSLPLRDGFALEPEQEAGRPRVFLRAQHEPNSDSRLELVISYGGNPYAGQQRTLDLFLYPDFRSDAGVSPSVTMTARVLTANGQVMASGNASLDVTGGAIAFGGKDRTVQLIMNCVPGGACFTPPVSKAVRLTVTRAADCPVVDPKGTLYAILFPTDVVTASRLWVSQANVDFTAADASAELLFDAPVGNYAMLTILDVGNDLPVANLSPQRGDLVSSVVPLQILRDRETPASVQLDSVVQVGTCLGGRQFLPPTLIGTVPQSPGNVSNPFVVGTSAPGSTVELFTGAGCTAANRLARGTADGNGLFAIQVVFTVSSDDPPSHQLFATATNDNGNTTGCSASSVTYDLDDIAPVPGPAFTASPVSTTEVAFTWSAATDNRSTSEQLRYQLCASTRPFSEGGCAPFVAFVTTGAGATSARMGGLQPSTRYSFFLRAVDQAGNASPGDQVVAVAQTQSLMAVSDVSAGLYHSCALVSGGEVWCWGRNDQGQLGDGTVQSRPTPAPVALPAPALMVSAGGSHTCALLTGGSVACWGDNTYGQLGLGDATVTGRLTPALIDGAVLKDVVQLSAGSDHTCAVTQQAIGLCWGRNDEHQQGADTLNPVLAPRVVTQTGNLAPLPFGTLTAVFAGNKHTCGLGESDAISGVGYCWGRNVDRQVSPYGSFATPSPTTMGGIFGFQTLSAGGGHTCYLEPTPPQTGPPTPAQSGRVRCQGLATDGQLGNGLTTFSGTTAIDPFQALTSGFTTSGFRSIVASARSTYVLDRRGVVKAWGANDRGQLGDGTTTARLTPVALQAIPPMSRLASSGDHACAIASTGELYCWGRNDFGQAGTSSSTNPQRVPTVVPGLSTASVGRGLGAGTKHACARLNDGTISCWGDNSSGQLGDGQRAPWRDTAGRVEGLSGLSGVASVSAGALSTCAVTTDGRVRCWGEGSEGQTGEGTTASSTTPGVVASLDNAVSVSVGGAFACALGSDGLVSCWGRNVEGQVGTYTSQTGSPSLLPVKVTTGGFIGSEVTSVTSVAAGDHHACALDVGGFVYCWGGNDFGQLGNADFSTSRYSAQSLPGLLAARLASGANHSCAATALGAVSCWGANSAGQLGDGTLTVRTTPVSVVGLAVPAWKLAAGADHTCALAANGSVRCWGANTTGQLGTGNTTPSRSPVSVAGVSNAVEVAAGTGYTCALLATGQVSCWGDNSSAQLGTTRGAARPLPGLVSPFP